KREPGACRGIEAVRERDREDHEPGEQRDRRIRYDDGDRSSRDRLLVLEIRAVCHHGAHTDAQREERMAERRENRSAGEIFESRLEQKYDAVEEATARHAVAEQHE